MHAGQTLCYLPVAGHLLSGVGATTRWFRWKVFALELLDHGTTAGILQARLEVARRLLYTLIRRTRLAGAGFVVLVRQLWFACFAHEKKIQNRNSANAGTPSSQAMKYFPMMSLLSER